MLSHEERLQKQTKKTASELDVVARACNRSPREAYTGRLP